VVEQQTAHIQQGERLCAVGVSDVLAGEQHLGEAGASGVGLRQGQAGLPRGRGGSHGFFHVCKTLCF
jgi:hypothetical protein